MDKSIYKIDAAVTAFAVILVLNIGSFFERTHSILKGLGLFFSSPIWVQPVTYVLLILILLIVLISSIKELSLARQTVQYEGDISIDKLIEVLIIRSPGALIAREDDYIIIKYDIRYVTIASKCFVKIKIYPRLMENGFIRTSYIEIVGMIKACDLATKYLKRYVTFSSDMQYSDIYTKHKYSAIERSLNADKLYSRNIEDNNIAEMAEAEFASINAAGRIFATAFMILLCSVSTLLLFYNSLAIGTSAHLSSLVSGFVMLYIAALISFSSFSIDDIYIFKNFNVTTSKIDLEKRIKNSKHKKELMIEHASSTELIVVYNYSRFHYMDIASTYMTQKIRAVIKFSTQDIDRPSISVMGVQYLVKDVLTPLFEDVTGIERR